MAIVLCGVATANAQPLRPLPLRLSKVGASALRPRVSGFVRAMGMVVRRGRRRLMRRSRRLSLGAPLGGLGGLLGGVRLVGGLALSLRGGAGLLHRRLPFGLRRSAGGLLLGSLRALSGLGGALLLLHGRLSLREGCARGLLLDGVGLLGGLPAGLIGGAGLLQGLLALPFGGEAGALRLPLGGELADMGLLSSLALRLRLGLALVQGGAPLRIGDAGGELRRWRILGRRGALGDMLRRRVRDAGLRGGETPGA